MSAQHTPGPWRAVAGIDQMSDFGTTIHHRGRYGVYSDADTHGDDKADADLIAAAPDLLAALQSAMDALGGECFDWGPARAAIAKAGGAS